jgi:E3 Ubiquitin ligase
MELSIFLFIIGVIFGIIAFFYKKKSNKFDHYVEVYSIGGIPFGIPVYFSAFTKVNQPLFSPLTNQPCVAFSLEVENQKKDQNGNINYVWENSNYQAIPFWVQDKTGFVYINPQNSEICLPINNQKSQINNSTKIMGVEFNNTRNYRESYLPINYQVNIFGAMSMEANAKIIQNSEKYSLTVTNLSKQQLVQTNKQMFLGLMILACGFFVFAVLGVLRIV